MQAYSYLAFLAATLACLALMDWRWRLAWWHDARRTAITLSLAVAFFLVWDIGGIVLGIFFSGHSAYASTIFLAPELPLEEPLFLLVLTYTTLLAWRYRQ